ncbi:MAG: hypothetical protein ACT4NU_11400 [Chromatiales bacterium]
MINPLLLRPAGGLAVLLMGVLAVSGCGQHAETFFPLQKGWRWVYRIDVTTMDGPSEKKYVIENLGRTVLEGQEVSARRTVDGMTHYYREDATGVLRVGESVPHEKARLFSKPRVVLPTAAVPTAPPWSNWEYTVALQHTGPPEGESLNKISVELQVQYIVESVDDDVVVPAGRFERCLRVRGKGVTHQNVGFYVGPTIIRVLSTEWFAPGVGLVKVERKETTSSPILPAGEYRMELEEFQRG